VIRETTRCVCVCIICLFSNIVSKKLWLWVELQAPTSATTIRRNKAKGFARRRSTEASHEILKKDSQQEGH
jgi:hypothetical protein